MIWNNQTIDWYCEIPTYEFDEYLIYEHGMLCWVFLGSNQIYFHGMFVFGTVFVKYNENVNFNGS